MQPFLPCFRWSPISLAPAYNKYLTSRSRLNIWSTNPILSICSCLEKVTYTDLLHYPGSKKLKKYSVTYTHAPPIPLVPPLIAPLPHLIGPPMLPFLLCSHWSPISLVPPCNLSYPALTGPHLIGPQCNPGYTVLIGPPSHWFPSLTPSTLFSLVPHLIGPPMRPWLHSSHWFPISLAPQCDPDYTVLIGPPSHWSPSLNPSTLFSLVPHLIGPPM